MPLVLAWVDIPILWIMSPVILFSAPIVQSSYYMVYAIVGIDIIVAILFKGDPMFRVGLSEYE